MEGRGICPTVDAINFAPSARSMLDHVLDAVDHPQASLNDNENNMRNAKGALVAGNSSIDMRRERTCIKAAHGWSYLLLASGRAFRWRAVTHRSGAMLPQISGRLAHRSSDQGLVFLAMPKARSRAKEERTGNLNNKARTSRTPS